MKEVYLNEIKHELYEKERVCDWQFIYIESCNVRVYFKPDEERETGYGFVFYAVENIGGVYTPEYEKDEWHPDFCFVVCVYKGIAYFDGIRHLYMGDESTDNYGYHYYPKVGKHIETLKIIGELEKKYCSDYEE